MLYFFKFGPFVNKTGKNFVLVPFLETPCNFVTKEDKKYKFGTFKKFRSLRGKIGLYFGPFLVKLLFRICSCEIPMQF